MYTIQANHRFRTKLQRHIYGHAIDAAIRPLNEEKAVQAAADLLGELFVFTVIFISLHTYTHTHLIHLIDEDVSHS